MSWLLGVLILSLIVRLLAVGWSLVLLFRTEYRYVGALTLLLVLITMRDALLVPIDGPFAGVVQSLATFALVALLISLAALGSVSGFSQLCTAHAVAEQQVETARAGRIGFWGWNLATGQLQIDPMLKQLLGYANDEIADQIENWNELLLPEDRQGLNDHIAQFLTATTDSCELRCRARHKQGHHLSMLIRSRAIRNEKHVAQQLYGIARAIVDETWIADLLESEQRLYQMTDSIKEVFWLATADQSRTLYVNRAYETVWGRSRERLYAQPHDWLEAVVPEDRQRVADLALGGSGTYDVEYRIVRPDGGIRWIHDRGFPVVNARGEVYRLAGLAEDVTRWKEADQQLRLIQTAIDQINDAVCITTAELDPPGPQIVYVNPAFTRMTGYSAAEVLGKTPRILQGPKTDRRVLDELREALSQQRSFSGEVINYRKDGSEFWLRWHIAPVWDETGRLTHWFAVQQDVSEQRRAAEALRDSERRYRLLAEYSTDLVSRHDAEGVCLFVSPSARTVLGFEPGELIGRRTFDLVHAEDLRDVQRTISNLSEASDRFQITCRVRCRDDRYVWLESIGRVVRDPQTGTFVESIVQSRDITERHTTEQRLRQLEAELAHVARLSTMGEMASGIAHELNQPLGAISNYAETSIALLQSGNVDPAQIRGDLEQIVRLTYRSSEIIRRLRGFIKKTEPRSEPVVLQDVIDEVIQFVERDMRLEDALIQYSRDVDRLTVSVDSVQIQQVLLNLLSNALDAVRQVPGPMRCVSIRATRTTPQHITVSVSDTGPGMPLEVARRVFDPFFTTKPNGLGMGLAISHSIVRAHGGTLTVQPGPAGGTTFRFTLPAARS